MKAKGWIARQPDGQLILSMEKPQRSFTRWWCYRFLDVDEMMPDLKWRDEPRKVEIEIKPIKNDNNESN